MDKKEYYEIIIDLWNGIKNFCDAKAAGINEAEIWNDNYEYGIMLQEKYTGHRHKKRILKAWTELLLMINADWVKERESNGNG